MQLSACTPVASQVGEAALGRRMPVSPDVTEVHSVVAPLLQLLSPSEAVAIAEAAVDCLPPTPAVVRLLLAASARYAGQATGAAIVGSARCRLTWLSC